MLIKHVLPQIIFGERMMQPYINDKVQSVNAYVLKY